MKSIANMSSQSLITTSPVIGLPHSTLSNQAPRQMQVGTTLFSLSGQRLDIPPVTLGPHQQRVFELSQWAQSLAFQKGSLQISYFGPERVVSGEVKVLRANHSLVFDEQLMEPEDDFKSSRLEGVWWLPSHQTDMSIVVSNTGEAQISANLTMHGPSGTDIGSTSISLSAHETRVVIAKELISNHERNLPEIGGMSISHNGVPGSVFASMLIQEPATGFSSIVELQDPDAAVSSRLDGAGLRIGRVAGAELNQVAVARNVGRSISVLSTRIVYTRRDGTDGVIPVRELRLSPGETSNLDLDMAVRRSGIDQALAAGLEFKYEGPPGSIVISALSVTSDGNQVLRVPLVDAAGWSHPTNSGKYHLTINRSTSSMVYLKNVTDETQVFTMSVEYPGGTYVAGLKSVIAGRTLVYDLKQLRDDQVPDEDGKKLPRDVTKGYLSWSARSTKNLVSGQMEGSENHVMIGRYEVADMVAGTSSTGSYGCACQPSFSDSWLERLSNGTWVQLSGNAIELDPGETVQLRAKELDSDCGGYHWHIASANFGSEHPTVATVNTATGVVTAVDGGETTVSANWFAAIYYPLYDCCEYLSWDPPGTCADPCQTTHNFQYHASQRSNWQQYQRHHFWSEV